MKWFLVIFVAASSVVAYADLFSIGTRESAQRKAGLMKDRDKAGDPDLYPDEPTIEKTPGVYTTKVLVFTTKIKADAAYKRALVWFTKAVGNANYAIQLKDADEKTIIAKGRACNDTSHPVTLTFEFKSKDSKARVSFEDIKYYLDPSQQNNPFNLGKSAQPGSAEDLSEVYQPCLHDLAMDLMKSVRADSKSDQW